MSRESGEEAIHWERGLASAKISELLPSMVLSASFCFLFFIFFCWGGGLAAPGTPNVTLASSTRRSFAKSCFHLSSFCREVSICLRRFLCHQSRQNRLANCIKFIERTTEKPNRKRRKGRKEQIWEVIHYLWRASLKSMFATVRLTVI